MKDEIETQDLFLKKAEFDDWKDMLKNIWSHEESAEYMLWTVVKTEDKAKERMKRVIEWQKITWNIVFMKGKADRQSALREWKKLKREAMKTQALQLDQSLLDKDMGTRYRWHL